MPEALGMIETKGLAALIEACDVMAKTEKVEIIGYEQTGGGYVTAIVRGEIAHVRTAVQQGSKAAAKVGKVITAHVIARPHRDVETTFPLGRADQVSPRPTLALPLAN